MVKYNDIYDLNRIILDVVTKCFNERNINVPIANIMYAINYCTNNYCNKFYIASQESNTKDKIIYSDDINYIKRHINIYVVIKFEYVGENSVNIMVSNF